jgi:hypothetical protein
MAVKNVAEKQEENVAQQIDIQARLAEVVPEVRSSVEKALNQSLNPETRTRVEDALKQTLEQQLSPELAASAGHSKSAHSKSSHDRTAAQ